MELLIVCVCACALMIMVILYRRMVAQEDKVHCLPPSPPGRTIIGHLHLLAAPLHHSLHKLSEKYGPILFIKMGSSPAVVISSPYWAKEFWHTHEREFLDRPQFEASKRIFYDNRTMVMMEYGPMWRELRKLYTVHVLSSKRVEMFAKARLEEMAVSIKLLESQATAKEGPVVVDMRKLVFNTVGNMISRMMFSKRSFDASEAVDGGEARFKKLVEESALLFGTLFLGDLIPWLSWLDVQGSRKRMDRVAKGFDMFFEGLIAERILTRRGDSDADYLDMLLRIYNKDGTLDKDSIKCILLDLMSAGIETMTTAVEWTLAELLKNPSPMKKLQEELDTLIVSEGGSNKCVEDAQLAKLEYLQAIIKESIRLHPPFTLNIRQMCKALDKGTQVGGFYLPKNTRVFLNLWAMARDTTTWGENADTFCPDRFLSDGVPDLRGQHYEFLPFGTGRRGCPGMSMALTLVPFIVANLVLLFNWEIPNGVTLDLSEAASFTGPLAKPLVAMPILRQST